MTQVLQFIQSLPSPIAQGFIWGIMAIGVYITYKILDLADLTVDGSFATGGAVLVVLTTKGVNIYLALLIAFATGCLAGFVTGIFHTKFGIPAILAGILTQLALYSINLRIMSGKANTSISKRNFNLIITSSADELGRTILICAIFVAVLIGVLYWFFGTELGNSIRATGCNQAMARANGINTDSRKIIGLVLSNGIVAMSKKRTLKNGVTKKEREEYREILKKLDLGLEDRLSSKVGLLSACVVAIFLGLPHWKAKVAAKHVKNDEKAGAQNA